MDLSTRLRLLDLIRVGTAADTAHRAADRALRKAYGAELTSWCELSLWRRHMDSSTSPADTAAHLAQAADTHRDRTERTNAARAKWLRTRTAAQRADRHLGRQVARHAGRRTGGQGRPVGGRAQLATGLLEGLAAAPVELIRAAHAICVQSSAGKDSVVALHRVVQWAKKAGCLDKVVVVHADVGAEAEYPGVRELAEQQAERYGLRFIVVKADIGFLGMVAKRGMWPDAQNRLCTSTLKRDVAAKLFTEIVNALGLDEQAIILNCLGIRAAESTARSKKHQLAIDHRASNGRRLVLTWHPIFHLSEHDIWQTIADETLDYHPVYDTLIPRLSCIFCILAPFDMLARAVRLCWALGLDTPDTYLELETRIGHRFKHQFSLAQVVQEATRLHQEEGPLTWSRGDAIRHHLGEDAADGYLQRLALAA
ncbi:phosphoadenosine phosphosulfate reductase family protein [Streptomyces sp. NBC_01304]|uniref:phosphoadenosine phosphosulfate reductase family protein n=1 Tax=Streptomyces sp. NBC_01304 TaxID=2903818 RepID=UPI002E139B30|nr:phosphoadenosine phosphosulfate reductase family protein [Streptomyces sp. NBC_01304]